MTKSEKIFADAARLAAIDAPAPRSANRAYRERFGEWEARAGVRNWKSDGGVDAGKLPFSPELVPLTRHALVRDRGETAIYHLLAQHLYMFCNFTEHVELEAIVPASVLLRFGDAPFGVPEALARDAGRVVIDEAWHAQCAGDLRAEIQSAVGVAPCRMRKPAFLHVLHVVKATLPERERRLADLVFACVSETLITSSLNHVPRDDKVITKVREVLGEHAREEGYHHAIFGQAMGVMWEQLSAEDRDFAGPLFGIFIAAFLRPDTLAEMDALESAGFSASEAKGIVEETHDEPSLRAELWRAAAPTVRFMRGHGLLDHATTQDMLADLALTTPTA